MTPSPRRILVIASVAFALGAPAPQMSLGLGLTAAEFSASGDSTLRAAAYAFSIWGVIYLGLIAYAVWQALPRQAADRALDRISAPAAFAIAGCGAWICASALDARWETVGIIVLSAAVLAVGLLRTAPASDQANAPALLFAWLPLGLLGGWLTIAAALNILTVATAEGLIGTDFAPAAALIGIVAVGALAVGFTVSARLFTYSLAIAWGLVAVWVAERADNSVVAWTAMAAAALVVAHAAWVMRPIAGRR